jgi:hypothetical protein
LETPKDSFGTLVAVFDDEVAAWTKGKKTPREISKRRRIGS